VKNWAFLVGIVVAIGAGARFAFAPAYEGKPQYLLFLIVPTIAIAALGMLRAYYDGVIKSWMSVRSGDFTRGFVGCAALFVAAWGFTKLVMPPASPRAEWLARIYLQIGDTSSLQKNVVLVVLAIILAAIAEEIVWRGLVTSLLEEVIGSRRAWIGAAVLYAAAHLPTVTLLAGKTAGANPLLPFAALGAGLLFGAMARHWGRLAPGIFAHILFDWAIVFMFRLWGT
jgi:hypothetical protein